MSTLWPAALPAEPATELGDHPLEFERLWRGFMTARATLGLVLSIFQGGIFALIPSQGSAPRKTNGRAGLSTVGGSGNARKNGRLTKINKRRIFTL